MKKQLAINQNLITLRTIGDEPADAIIAQLVALQGIDSLRELMPFLSDFKQTNFSKQPQILRDFLAKNASLPHFYDKKTLIRATDFYTQHKQIVGLVLGLYSLPYCYLGADGAKVLYLSERIRNDTKNRLIETGNFLREVMNYDNWENNKITAICMKVRLLHAVIRYFTLHSNRWDIAWGYPINQEDMLGTNLSFSFIVLKGMRKLGYSVDEIYEKSYLITWNIIGVLLGVKTENLPQNYIEMIKVERQIATRQFRESIESKALTKSLMEAIRKLSPNEFTADLLQEQSRFLLGKEYAQMLGIEQTNMPKSLLKIYQTTSALMASVF